MVRMNGTCIPNASRKIAGVDLIGLCMSTGSGIKTSGECVCDSGYSQIADSNGARWESELFRIISGLGEGKLGENRENPVEISLT